MKNTTNDIQIKYTAMKTTINEIIDYKKVVIDYFKEPERVINELGDKYDDQVFKDIATGLRGDMTREKAVILGKKVILDHLKKLNEKCLEELTSLYKEPANVVDTLIINTDTLTEVALKDDLVSNINSIKANVVKLEYLETNIDRIITPKLVNELSKQKDIKTYLNAVLSILHDMVYVSKIDKAVSDNSIRSKSITSINNTIHIMLTENTVSETTTATICSLLKENTTELINIDTTRDSLIDIVSNNPIVPGIISVSDYFLDIFDLTKTRLTDVVKMVNFLKDVIVRLGENTVIANALTANFDNVEKYFNNEMTTDVAESVFSIYNKMLLDGLEEATIYTNVYVAEMIWVNNQINLLSEIYDNNKEVIIKSTLPKSE